MRPDSDEYYCYQWCGRMRWACVRDATGRYCKWVLVRSSGRIVPGWAESWGKYQQGISLIILLRLSKTSWHINHQVNKTGKPNQHPVVSHLYPSFQL
jgi:hypothetical protein